MHCLIVDTQASRLDNNMIAFLNAGLQVTGTSSLRVAETCLRTSSIDVLMIDKGPIGPSHARLIQLAELRNEQLISLILTPDVARDTDRLIATFPSVHCVLGDGVAPRLAAKLALGSLAEKTVTSGFRFSPAPTRASVSTLAPAPEQAAMADPAPAAPALVFHSTRSNLYAA